jgi:hypothetical protein
MTDREWVKAFSDALEPRGLSTEFDFADFPRDSSVEEALREAILASKTLIAILSPNSVRSQWIFFQLGAAIAEHKRIIAVAA